MLQHSARGYATPHQANRARRPWNHENHTHDQNAVSHIAALSTYAPHNGYTVGERNQHWKLAQETIEEIPTTNLSIWRADANGEIGNRNRNGANINKIIGIDTMARTAEPGNGGHMQNICKKHEHTPMNTWRWQPKTTKQGPMDISTWIHPAGTIKRQIDYIMVSRKYRNCVRKHTLSKNCEET